jgi:uncharacterized protein YecE (DUF72 family)
MNAARQVLIGTAGFQYPDWKGIVYPADVKKRYGHELAFLAQFFDCCEINTSFYGHIRPNVGKDWCGRAAAVNPGFLFTAKLFQGFTHSPRGVRPASPFNLAVGAEDEALARAGLDSIASEGKLGALLIQFPVSFKNADDTRDYLFALLEKFKEYPLVLEIRHQSWNDPDILARLTEAGVGFCNIDQPRLGKSLTGTQYTTSAVGYVRLHGRNYKDWFQAESRNDRYNYLYKRPELEKWAENIERVSEGARITFVVANNHPEGRAAVNALELKSLLTRTKVKMPETLIHKYPEARDFAEKIGKPLSFGE